MNLYDTIWMFDVGAWMSDWFDKGWTFSTFSTSLHNIITALRKVSVSLVDLLARGTDVGLHIFNVSVCTCDSNW